MAEGEKGPSSWVIAHEGYLATKQYIWGGGKVGALAWKVQGHVCLGTLRVQFLQKLQFPQPGERSWLGL